MNQIFWEITGFLALKQKKYTYMWILSKYDILECQRPDQTCVTHKIDYQLGNLNWFLLYEKKSFTISGQFIIPKITFACLSTSLLNHYSTGIIIILDY